MATRYLTELFSLMRNSHSYRNNHFSRDSDSERLLKRKNSGSDEEVELNEECMLPPSWYDLVENTKYTISKVATKMVELEALHKKLLRPDFVEKSDDEIQMEILGQEISKLIGIAHKNIMVIKSHQFTTSSGQERKLIENIVRGLIVILQNQTATFRNEQNAYLKQIHSLEEYTNDFFDSLNFNGTTNEESANKTSVETFDNFLKPTASSSSGFNPSQLDDLENDERLDEYFQIKPNQKLNQKQLLQFEIDNTKMMEAREKEVMGIVKSIVELNQVYKDLSNLVQEQGTILDRIDYNVESTQSRVYQGLKELQKAERYHRTNRKMYCIFILSVVTLFMIILLILTKL
ncbi:CLUMA_CG017490, isoform A [Clunio marinus]|uniref:CLUMA_CG017490, isoform A n=1 Tax=Clunio marinus TaxID=568069 RepID=A0A1J1IXW2_9DIPT|nr:CLUMA_CG017490, isoform A [Clunio marinus]